MTLREYLSKEGLTYRAAAARWGVHWTRVSQLCSGKRRPRNATRTWLHVLTKGAVGVADADWPLAQAPAPSAWDPGTSNLEKLAAANVETHVALRRK